MADDEGYSDDDNLLSPWLRAALQLLSGLLPALTAIVAGAWVAFTYIDQQREQENLRAAQTLRDSQIRSLEARKPFLDKQFSLYNEAAQVVGRLVTTTGYSPEWAKDFQRYEQLYWTELSLVEDEGVKTAMQELYPKLMGLHNSETVNHHRFAEARDSAYRLAVALKAGIANSWELNLTGSTR